MNRKDQYVPDIFLMTTVYKIPKARKVVSTNKALTNTTPLKLFANFDLMNLNYRSLNFRKFSKSSNKTQVFKYFQNYT